MAPTVKEIAKKANVSIATVSRALNNDEKVKEDTRKLILSVAEELNYKPNIFARNFVKKKSNIIGLILPDISDEFFSEIIRGVDLISYSHGYYTTVASSHDNRSIEETISTVIGSGLVGGIILLVPKLTDEILNALKIRDLPVVLISGDNGLKKFSSISINNYQGAYDMVEFLLAKGYKEIAFIEGPAKNNDAFLRKQGFLKACEDNGIKIDNSWIVTGDFTKSGGRKACRKLLKLKNKPKAIFASNDMMALGCYEIISQNDLRVPDDFAVVGFDDIRISRYLTPPLTTVKVQIPQIGQNAAKLIIKEMETKHTQIQNIKIPTELVIRMSA